MKHVMVLVSLLVLAGCTTPPKFMENRVTCTVAGDEAHVVSKWGLVGFAAKLADADRKVICKSE